MSIYKEMFNGSDYVPKRDDVRLGPQIRTCIQRNEGWLT